MTFEDIAKANATIKTTDVGHGKEYAEVNQRIKAFRMVFPNGCIWTEMISNADGVCIFKAYVKDGEGNTLGTGTAYEKEGSTFINKTSYIENCETSAVGRALAMCGFGIDTSIASYEEVSNAMANQGEVPKPKKNDDGVAYAKAKADLLKIVNDNGLTIEAVSTKYGITTPFDEWTTEQIMAVSNRLSKVVGKEKK